MGETDGGIDLLQKEKIKVSKPKLFRVVLLNDDYTPMDFVVSILESIFSKSPSEAIQIMMRVHNDGRGVCGMYPKEIAETKVYMTHSRAKKSGHPLKAIMEPDD